MDNTSIGADAAKLAGLQIDAFQKVKNGHITLEHLRWFNNLTKKQRDALLYYDLNLIKPRWTEQEGVIRFSVTSDGTTGEEWISRLESKGFNIDDSTKSVLRSSHFKLTNGMTYKIAVLKGMLFKDGDRNIEKIYIEANKRELLGLINPEAACLIREKFMNSREIKAMGLWSIVIINETIEDFNGNPTLLYVSRKHLFGGHYSSIEDDWGFKDGFAFQENP